MHLKFSHRGRQFFFLTIALKGRPKLLSKIVEVEKVVKPTDRQVGTGGAQSGARGGAPSVVRSYDIELSRYGEIVIEHWKRQHALNAALTASARVVMPDHCYARRSHLARQLRADERSRRETLRQRKYRAIIFVSQA